MKFRRDKSKDNPEMAKRVDQVSLDDPRIAQVAAEAINKAKASLEIFGDEDDAFVCQLRAIKNKLGIHDGVQVVYPGSSTHVGVARVFGPENVVHVDPANEAVNALQAAGYKAVEQGIEVYNPSNAVDLLVALNSYGSPTKEIIERLVRPGGHVIANNYTHWANELNDLRGVLKLVTAIMPAYDAKDAVLVEAENLRGNETDLGMSYYKIEPSGRLASGTPEDHNFAELEPAYPDALFVFEKI